jgi:hypothetical protein
VIEIPLTQGKVAIIDDEDWPLVSSHKWHASAKTNYSITSWYAVDSKRIPMHQILGGKRWDHINGDSLDNRRSNLRPATHQQNNCNTGAHFSSTSKYKGVSWATRQTKWVAQIKVFGHNKHIGVFTDEHKAALAYDQAARQYHGEFAWLNADHFEELR